MTNRPVTKSRTRRPEARPAEILASALDLFAEKGFSATRMEDVAARAGLSKAGVYLYFEDKMALLKALVNELSRFKKADIVWCQEEPKNMGSWTFVEPYLEWVLGQTSGKTKRARYVGRPASAATATGLMSKHLAQLKAFLDEAFAA